MKLIEKYINNSDKCHKESWRILKYHGIYCKGISDVYYALSRAELNGALDIFEKLVDKLSEIEMEIHPYFDLCLLHRRTMQVIEGK